MHITSMTIAGIPPFTEPVEFTFDERVNVFVGPNASGKSTAIACLSGWSVDAYDDSEGRQTFEVEVSDDGFVFPDYNVPRPENITLGSLPMVYIPATRMLLPNLRTIADNERDLLQWRKIEPWFRVLTERESPQVFDPRIVYQAMYMIDEGLHRDEFGSGSEGETSRYPGVFKVMTASFDCVKGICDIVQNARMSHYQDRTYFTNFAMESPIVHPSMGAYTNDPPKFGVERSSLFLGDLSSGTQGTFLWIMYLAVKIAEFYDFVGDWDTKPAILFIDEIENHLHPTWQRRVIPALLEHFPGLQIFATTHSPFVIAGLKAGQVHMLKRDASGIITASPSEHDIIGWTTDEILRTFMDVDEPTDQLTIDRRERLLELRRKEALTDAEAAEMEALRRQVNEDFLSSSTPLGAQRERYGDMMLEFLRSRQSELSQDGS